jgi:hypothetical protein
MASPFSFPNPVNEKAARVVAGGVLVLSLLTIATGWFWILVVLAYGFIARVLAGPTFSPLGRLASSVVAPRLGAPRPVPGPPKRFAQAIGAVLTTAGALVALVAHDDTVAIVLLALMVVAAGLESIFAICVGCRLFSVLMGLGVIPASVCAECTDVRLRSGPA